MDGCDRPYQEPLRSLERDDHSNTNSGVYESAIGLLFEAAGRRTDGDFPVAEFGGGTPHHPGTPPSDCGVRRWF